MRQILILKLFFITIELKRFQKSQLVWSISLKLSVQCTNEIPGSNLTGFHEDALHCFPVAVWAADHHAVHFSLAMDGSAVLFSRHRQQSIGGRVAEPNWVIPLPNRACTQNGPLVQMVSLTILTKGTDLLIGKSFWVNFHSLLQHQNSTYSTYTLQCDFKKGWHIKTWFEERGEVK